MGFQEDVKKAALLSTQYKFHLWLLSLLERVKEEGALRWQMGGATIHHHPRCHHSLVLFQVAQIISDEARHHPEHFQALRGFHLFWVQQLLGTSGSLSYRENAQVSWSFSSFFMSAFSSLQSASSRLRLQVLHT